MTVRLVGGPMIHRYLQALSLSLALFGSAACFPELWPEPSNRPATQPERVHGGTVVSVTILAASDSVEVGQLAVLNFELRSPPGKTLPYSVPVSWASSDTSVATVENGYVLGKRVGVTTISATAKGVVGTKALTVTGVHK